jgi:hypothetical protein
MRLSGGTSTLGGFWQAGSPWRVRSLVILVLLAANVAIGFGAVSGNYNIIPIAILIAAAVFLGLLLLLHLGRFEYGILLIPLAAGLLDFAALPTGTQSRVVLSLVVAFGLAGLWILQWIVIDKRVRLKPSPINAPLLGFIIISFISYAWSTVLRDPLVIVPPSFQVVQLGALAVNVMLPFLALMVSNKIQDSVWLRRLNVIVVGLGVLAVVSFLFQLPTSVLISNGARGVFPAWVGALVCAQALFNDKLAKWQRILLLVFLGVVVYYYFIQIPDWFSGWFPLGLALSVILFRRSKKLFVVAMLAATIFLANHPSLITQNVIGRAESKGDFERLSLWQTNLELVAQHPLLGVGPAGYAVYYMTYHPENSRSSHNNYFDVLSQTGLIGFVVFLYLLAVFARICLDNCRNLAGQRNFEDAFANALLAGCLSAVAAMMLGDWVLPFAYNQTITGFDNASLTWIMLGAAVSLHHIITARHSAITENKLPFAAPPPATQ